MTTRAPAWRFTGLHWESAQPVLTACPLPDEPGRPPGAETRRPAAPGSRIAWRLPGARACTGIWTSTGRRHCPLVAAVSPDTADSQCAACSRADHGRQIARDASAADDGREYLLYLAWFGPGLLKVGLTAASRGRDRLLEQGAVTFTFLAAGPYTPVRRAEQLASATGLAAEQVTARAKASAWHALPPAAERAELLTAAREQLTSRLRWPDHARPLPGMITDQAANFGLDGEIPGNWQEVTSISDGAVLAGEVRLVIGRRFLLDTPAGPLLCDMRRAAGRTIQTIPGSAPAPDGLTLASRHAPGALRDNQQLLF